MHKIKKQKGITLIALVITIVVMLILVGVTISVSLKGGLFSTAKEAVNETQIAQEEEELLIAALGTLNKNGEVDLSKLDSSLPEGFTGSNGQYTSKTGNVFIVTDDGTITLKGEVSGGEVSGGEVSGGEVSGGEVSGEEPETPTKDPALNPDDGSTPAEDDFYIAGDYGYIYYEYIGGWRVYINYNVISPNQTSYGPILESINGEPVTSMEETFRGIPLTTAPKIPSSVTNMSGTFNDCTSLTTAPEIPNGVTNMDATFVCCTSLTTAPEIPSSVTNMNNTFYQCTSLVNAPDMSNASSVTTMIATFNGCTSLTSAPVIPSSVTDMDGTFTDCTTLTGTIEIPCSLASEDYTFSNCPATITYYHVDGCDGSCGA